MWSTMDAAPLDEDELRELTLSISRLPRPEIEELQRTIHKLVCAFARAWSTLPVVHESVADVFCPHASNRDTTREALI